MADAPDYGSQTALVESGNNPTATNPLSSAGGLGQFLDSTWLGLVKQYHPELADLPQAQILGLKSDPVLSKEMIDNYGNLNGQYLAQRGLPVTNGTKYLAHFAGPQGAASVLSADPSAPVSGILGDKVVAANPFLRNMTAADLRGWAEKKMGGPPLAAPQPPQQSVAQQQPQQQAQPVQQPVQQQLPALGSMPSQPQTVQADAMPMAAPLNAPPPIQQIIRQLNMRQAFSKIPIPQGFKGFSYS